MGLFLRNSLLASSFPLSESMGMSSRQSSSTLVFLKRFFMGCKEFSSMPVVRPMLFRMFRKACLISISTLASSFVLYLAMTL